MRRRAAPGISLSVQERETVISDIVAAVRVDDVGAGRGGDVEGVAADDGFVVQSDGAGDEGQLRFRDVRARLEEPPLGAILVGPAAPGLRDVVLGVKGGVVGGVAVVGCFTAGEAGLDESDVDPVDVVEHLSGQGCGLRGVASRCY